MANDREANVKLGVKNAALRRGLKTAQGDVDKLVREGTGKIGGVLRGQLGGLAAGILAGAGLAQFVQQLDDIAKASDRLGLSKKFLQEFNFQLGQTSVTAQEGDTAMQAFIRRVSEARQGVGQGKKALAELNVTLVDGNGRAKDMEQLFREVADALDNTADDADKVRLAYELFSRSGVKMVQVLKGGSEQMAVFAAQAREAGLIIEDELIDATVRLADSMDVLKRKALTPAAEALGNFIVMAEDMGARIGELSAVVETLFSDGLEAAGKLRREIRKANAEAALAEEEQAAAAKHRKAEAEALAIKEAEATEAKKRLATAQERELALEEAIAEAKRGKISLEQELNEKLDERARLRDRLAEADLGALDAKDFAELVKDLSGAEGRVAEIQRELVEGAAKEAQAIKEGALTSIELLEKEKERAEAEIERLKASVQTAVTDLERVGGSLPPALVNAQAFSFRDDQAIRQREEIIRRADTAIRLLRDQAEGGGALPADNFGGGV